MKSYIESLLQNYQIYLMSLVTYEYIYVFNLPNSLFGLVLYRIRHNSLSK